MHRIGRQQTLEGSRSRYQNASTDGDASRPAGNRSAGNDVGASAGRPPRPPRPGTGPLRFLRRCFQAPARRVEAPPRVLQHALRAWTNNPSLLQAQHRVTAAERIILAHERNDTMLDLRGLGLTSLPEGLDLLVGVRNLDISGNRLDVLPPLPAHLTELNARGNHLTYLPALPPDLTVLSVARNRFIRSPQLPPRLLRVDLSHNLLSELLMLPESTEVLNRANNRFSRLPPVVEAIMRRGNLDVSYNPWSPDEAARIRALPPDLRVRFIGAPQPVPPVETAATPGPVLQPPRAPQPTARPAQQPEAAPLNALMRNSAGMARHVAARLPPLTIAAVRLTLYVLAGVVAWTARKFFTLLAAAVAARFRPSSRNPPASDAGEAPQAPAAPEAAQVPQPPVELVYDGLPIPMERRSSEEWAACVERMQSDGLSHAAMRMFIRDFRNYHLHSSMEAEVFDEKYGRMISGSVSASDTRRYFAQLCAAFQKVLDAAQPGRPGAARGPAS